MVKEYPQDELLDQIDQLPTKAPAASQVLRRGCNYSHEAMIDLIISCPGISQNDLAHHFGYSPSWISTIMASDAFQVQLAKRRSEVVDPILLATVEEKFRGIANRSADVLMEKLAAPAAAIPDSLALRSFELASRAAGYGARQEAPAAAPAEIHLHLEALGGNLTNLLRRKKLEALEYSSEDSLPKAG